MKVKIFKATVTSDLEADVNKFIAKKDVNIIKMDFSTSTKDYAVMVTYETHGFVIENEEAL
ncbi:MAG: hypothetical protein LBC82_01975 [Oscillospiraceae bacterium]|jgi:hypothetical protein|nr:hypothetical protein [Oscillospiraceae bacterium]